MRCIVKSNNIRFSVFGFRCSPRIPNREPITDNRAPRQGFTFVEMLIVTVLVAAISLVIYSTFSQGVKIWQRLNQKIQEEDINIFFEKISRDLRNSFTFGNIEFIGAKDEVRFATLVGSQNKMPALKMNIGEVSYSFDSQSRTIMQHQKNYSQVYEEEPGLSQSLLSNIESLNFQYYFYDDEKKEYIWQEEWQRDGSPKAVRVQLELGGDIQDNKFVETISIPVGG